VNIQNEVEFWLAASKRQAQQGNPAAAITFKNLAWLVENVSVREPVKSAEQQALEYLATRNSAR
jgi:hypothetical protein